MDLLNTIDLSREFCPNCENQCSDLCDTCNHHNTPYSNFKCEILQCPFCGGGAILKLSKIQIAGFHFCIICGNDDCEAQPYVIGDTVESTVAIWNLRK